MCFSCFSQFRPRYKRLVDDIFPALPQDGLVKSNMEKLTFYALSSPEKLDRIGEYLYQKASRDITRRREGYVKIAMEAMDQLLVACHSQTLNLFVESFLRIVQKLLECPEPELQILATQSFVRFANIEEDTPSYHRRYDFFVSKFSSMCHNNDQNVQLRDRIRLAGIKGLQGVIRKTVSDDLVENIWEAVHMDKIIPSLLYNMQNPRHKAEEECLSDHADTNELLHCNDHEEKDPTALAESCFRELVGRASFGHVKSVLRPVLRHFDLHNLWVSKPFAIHCFRLIMFSIQSQYMYTVIESLMIHLDENSKLPSKIRTNVADVLSKIIAIAAGESIGPTVLEIINSLLTHLRTSVTRRNANLNEIIDEDEKSYQEALIVALGEFAAHLPDYQKIEIMMFIMSKIAYSKSTSNFSHIDNQIQHICLKSLLMVCSKYSSAHMTATLPHSFLDPLLRCSYAVDPEIRLLVQNVLHLLFDRHGNGPKLSKPKLDFAELNLTYEKCSRTDSIFMRKHCPELYKSLCESLEHTNNSIDNVEAVYKTMALLCIEFTSKETFNEFFYAVLALQDLALVKDLLPSVLQYQLHTIAVCLLSLAAYVHSIAPLQTYVDEIVEKRRNAKAHHLLPELCMHYEVHPQSALPEGVLLDETNIVERLHEAGIDLTKIYLENITSMGKHNMPLAHRNSWTETYSSYNSVADYLNSSEGSEPTTPCLESQLPQDFTFEGMKSVLTTKHEEQRCQVDAYTAQLFEKINNSSFDLWLGNGQNNLQFKLGEILKNVNTESSQPVKNDCDGNKQTENYKPLLDSLFPECFVY